MQIFNILTRTQLASIPLPPGQILGLDGVVEEGRLVAAIAVHQLNRENRMVSLWNENTSKRQPSREDSGPRESEGRTPRRRPGIPSGPWIPCTQGAPWSGPPLTIKISPDGSVAAVPEPDGSVNLWNLVSESEDTLLLKNIPKGNDLVTALAFTPDSKKLAVGYFGNSAFIYDVGTEGTAVGAVSAPMTHDGGIMDIRISGDKAKLLTVSLDQTARLWDASSGLPLSEPMRHQSYVIRGFFSEDGRRAISIATDGEAKVWNLMGGSAQGTSLPIRGDRIFSSISPDWKTKFTIDNPNMAASPSGFQGYLESWQLAQIGNPLEPGAYVEDSTYREWNLRARHSN